MQHPASSVTMHNSVPFSEFLQYNVELTDHRKSLSTVKSKLLNTMAKSCLKWRQHINIQTWCPPECNAEA